MSPKVSQGALKRALGRLALLRFFPQNNSEAVTGVAEILSAICSDDTDLAELVHEVLANHNDWCGPLSLRETQAGILGKRAAAERQRILDERTAEARRQNRIHESDCPGYCIELNEEHKTVDVSFCRATFGDGWPPAAQCGRGPALQAKDPAFCQHRLVEELAARPGWRADSERWKEFYESLGGVKP
jgi:hypothetical protein